MLVANVLFQPLPGSVETVSLKKRSKLQGHVVNVFAVQRLKKVFSKRQFIDKNGIVVPENVQLSLQSKYSFTALFVIKYAKIYTGIFSRNLLTTRGKIL